MHLKFHFFHFGCCNLPFLHFSFWFLPVKTLKKYSEYSEHLFEYSNIIRLFKMGRIRIRIVLFGKKYSNIRIIRIFVSTLIHIHYTCYSTYIIYSTDVQSVQVYNILLFLILLLIFVQTEWPYIPTFNFRSFIRNIHT